MFLKMYEDPIIGSYKPLREGELVLRDYQREGRDWLEKKERAFLTDWPGLGKTLQASEAAKDHGPILVVAPTYLTRQWYTFLRTQYPDDRVIFATGKLNRFQREARLKASAKWYIVNVQMMRNFTMPKQIRTIIFDESHHLRNRTTLHSIGAAEFASDMSRRVYMLSASPMWKSTDDIWMQLHILQPEIFDDYKDFINYFMIVDESTYGTKVLGVKRQTRKELEAMLSVLKFGRTYKDVGVALPPTIETDIVVDFPPELFKSYETVRKNYRLQMEQDESLIFSSYMEVMHTLRALTNFGGKQEACRDRIEDVGKPTLTFSVYKETAYDLAKFVPNSIALTGDVTPEKRHTMAMQAMKKGQNIFATVQSLAEGINLQDYRHVIFYDCDWAPGRNFQAVSRVVRSRNDRGKNMEPVLVDHLHVAKSIDTGVHKVSKGRSTSIKDVMSEILM